MTTMEESKMKTESTLKDIPDNFNRNAIINCRQFPTQTRGRTVRLCKCDYLPIERNHFKGWFAFPDTISPGRREPRHALISRIVLNGGVCTFACLEKGKTVKSQNVVIMNAFQDHNNVVVHIDNV